MAGLSGNDLTGNRLSGNAELIVKGACNCNVGDKASCEIDGCSGKTKCLQTSVCTSHANDCGGASCSIDRDSCDLNCNQLTRDVVTGELQGWAAAVGAYDNLTGSYDISVCQAYCTQSYNDCIACKGSWGECITDPLCSQPALLPGNAATDDGNASPDGGAVPAGDGATGTDTDTGADAGVGPGPATGIGSSGTGTDSGTGGSHEAGTGSGTGTGSRTGTGTSTETGHTGPGSVTGNSTGSVNGTRFLLPSSPQTNIDPNLILLLVVIIVVMVMLAIVASIVKRSGKQQPVQPQSSIQIIRP